jgi:PAS domain S-box-containing protein
VVLTPEKSRVTRAAGGYDARLDPLERPGPVADTGGVTLPSHLSEPVARALHNVSVPSYVLDRAGTIRWLNAAAQELVGDVRGRPVIELISPDDRDRAQARFERQLRGERQRDFRISVIGKDGRRVPVEVSSTPLEGEHHAVGVFGLVVNQPPRRSRNRARHRLTPRQHEVLLLLADGASTDQIAEGLHLSKETVRNHVRHILRALGAHSRLEAVAVAHREGLI